MMKSIKIYILFLFIVLTNSSCSINNNTKTKIFSKHHVIKGNSNPWTITKSYDQNNKLGKCTLNNSTDYLLMLKYDNDLMIYDSNHGDKNNDFKLIQFRLDNGSYKKRGKYMTLYNGGYDYMINASEWYPYNQLTIIKTNNQKDILDLWKLRDYIRSYKKCVRSISQAESRK